MWYMHDGGWWGFGWAGGLIMIIFWLAVIALIIWAVSRSGHRHHEMTPTDKTPLDIAKERYAKGEITKEQFDQIKRDLG